MNNMAVLQRVLSGTQVKADYIQLKGGLDEVTPPHQRKSGLARAAQNFESVIHGGYRRVAGYERFSGKAKPSDASYAILNVAITGSFAVGNTITGVTSGATGVVLSVFTSATPNYLVITKVTGTFVSAETLNVGGSPQGTTSSAAAANSASTPLLHATYKNLAADNYRADIAAIPGSGNTLGVIEHNDVVYGFRNNAGGTAAAIYKSSSTGWVAVPLGEEISFTAGNSSVEDGDTLTQGAVTATIKRVVATSGATPNIVGRLVIYGRSGGNFAAGAATSTGGGALTLSGAQTAITPQPNGRYQFVRENFGGAANTTRIYGCDGVNKGFEFDGTDYGYVPIATGMTTDAPSNVIAHKKQLFFSFLGSVQHSAPGTPYIWSAVVGASELGMGDTVTGFAVQPGDSSGGALAIFTRNRLSILYGSGVTDWQLVPYRTEVGAYQYTIQDVGFTMFLDDPGITDLQTSQNYGNFAHNAVSDQIKDTMNSLRLTAISSCISRDKSQYRVFFSSGYAIYITLVGRKVVGVMKMLFPDAARCAWSGEQTNGTETIYFGSADGYVYQMEKGASFDGDAIEAHLYLAWNFQGAPRVNKRYRDCTLEISGNGYATLSFGYGLGYESTAIPQPNTRSVELGFSSSTWDSFTWDNFYWDGVTLMPNALDIDGDAENISIAVTMNSDLYEPFTITAALLHYTPRGRLRP